VNIRNYEEKSSPTYLLFLLQFNLINNIIPFVLLNQGTTNPSHAGSQAVDGNTDGEDSNGNIGGDEIDTANLGINNISANGGTNGSNNIRT
jgi:hypothetical protein